MNALAKRLALTHYTEQAHIAMLERQRDELASLLTLIKIGLESGTVESKPIMDMSNEEAKSVEPVALLSLINDALAKLK